MKKNSSLVSLIALLVSFASVAVADILPAGEGAKLISEVQCATAVGAKGTHDLIRTAKGRADGIVDRCAGESCAEHRQIILRRNNNGIDVVCSECTRALVFGTIELPAGLDRSYSGPAVFVSHDAQGARREQALNCIVDIAPIEIVKVVPQAPFSGNGKSNGTPQGGVQGGMLPETEDMDANVTSATWLDNNFWDQERKQPSRPRARQTPRAKPRAQQQQKKPKPQPTRPANGGMSGMRMIVCPVEDGVRVRTESLNDIAFEVAKGDVAVLLSSSTKSRVLGGKRYEFVFAQFPSERNRTGWIAKQLLKDKCGGRGPVAPRPKPEPEPTPEPEIEPQPEPEISGTGKLSMQQLLAPNCARSKILSSAKSVVKRVWRNRSNGGGQCALGVRQSLQASRVGGINGGIGHAADFIYRLKGFGYVDTGIRDPKKAPPGSIIVLGGPYTQKYFKTGRMSRPYGNWVGHVTIKGDDGYYYTDGRTPEVAIGWSNDQNRRGIRNVIGIFVPGSDLVIKHRGTCDSMK